jgi:hypothetical protein
MRRIRIRIRICIRLTRASSLMLRGACILRGGICV